MLAKQALSRIHTDLCRKQSSSAPAVFLNAATFHQAGSKILAMLQMMVPRKLQQLEAGAGGVAGFSF